LQIDAQDFLPLAEKAEAVGVLDMEATGVKGDYNSLLVVTVKPYGKKPITLSVDTPGDDRKLVREARDLLHEFPLWISYYGKGFDIPMLQSRLLRHGYKPLEKKLHLDMYWHMKAHTLTARRSQAHLLEWLETPSKKMTLSAELWNEVLKNPKKGLHTLKLRCESDTIGLENLYDRTKHLIVNVTR
jgi:uncharacterized protein YprB with RNaseH-like and TPR domain